MHGFDAKIAFDLLNKSQTANCNCFRPPIVALPARPEALPLPIGGVLVAKRPFPQTRITPLARVDRQPNTAQTASESHDNRCAAHSTGWLTTPAPTM